MAEDKNKGNVIMEAKIHCDSCKYQVYKAVVGYPGVEDIKIDIHERKVTLKAPTVDAKKLFDTMKKKSKGKITKLIYPDLKNLPKKEEKEEQKKDVTVVLKIHNHCKDCRRKFEKAAWKVGDIYSVQIDGDILTIKGKNLVEKKVCEELQKKTKKHVEVVPPKKDDGKKDDGKPSAITQVTLITYPPQYFSDENPNACVVM